MSAFQAHKQIWYLKMSPFSEKIIIAKVWFAKLQKYISTPTFSDLTRETVLVVFAQFSKMYIWDFWFNQNIKDKNGILLLELIKNLH